MSKYRRISSVVSLSIFFYASGKENPSISASNTLISFIHKIFKRKKIKLRSFYRLSKFSRIYSEFTYSIPLSINSQTSRFIIPIFEPFCTSKQVMQLYTSRNHLEKKMSKIFKISFAIPTSKFREEK